MRAWMGHYLQEHGQLLSEKVNNIPSLSIATLMAYAPSVKSGVSCVPPPSCSYDGRPNAIQVFCR